MSFLAMTEVAQHSVEFKWPKHVEVRATCGGAVLWNRPRPVAGLVLLFAGLGGFAILALILWPDFMSPGYRWIDAFFPMVRRPLAFDAWMRQFFHLIPVLLTALGVLTLGFEETFILKPHVITRQRRYFGSIWERDFFPGKLVLILTYDDMKDPEGSLRNWEIELEDHNGCHHRMVMGCLHGWQPRFPLAEPRAALERLQAACGWETNERFTLHIPTE